MRNGCKSRTPDSYFQPRELFARACRFALVLSAGVPYYISMNTTSTVTATYRTLATRIRSGFYATFAMAMIDVDAAAFRHEINNMQAKHLQLMASKL